MPHEYVLYIESGPRMKTTMAHIPELLGCVANGPTTEDALGAAPGEIRRFLQFLQEHGENADPDAEFTTRIAQHVIEGPWIGYGDPEPGFEFDFEPLTRGELAKHLVRLRWMGEDLAAIAGGLTAKELTGKPPKGRSLYDIFQHVAAAEPEYARTAGAGKPEGAKELIAAIEESPERIADALPQLFETVAAQFESIPDEALNKVTQRGKRPYTARRGLRRALEHPWEHFREIERRLKAGGNMEHRTWN
jgi:predicted RNase H-like HicB family nuclease